MREVKEGNRNDICHFESLQLIPIVADADVAPAKTIGHAAAPHATTMRTTPHAIAPASHASLAVMPTNDDGDHICAC